MRHRSLLFAVVASALLTVVPASAAPVIQRGVDVFKTPGDGRTFYDFSQNPIPAGFFCDGSKAFAERVAFKGLPLATAVPDQLRGADTIIERLDNANLDDRGVGSTRLRFRALSLVSLKPIQTSCGALHVYVTLAGPQRETRMEITQTRAEGGTFLAPLAVDARLTFIPVKAAGTRSARSQGSLQLTASFTFPADPLPWSFNHGMKRIGAATVDTDGDQKPDTQIPAASNFAPGRTPGRITANFYGCPGCAEWVCHAGDGEEHCYWAPPPPGCVDAPICSE